LNPVEGNSVGELGRTVGGAPCGDYVQDDPV